MLVLTTNIFLFISAKNKKATINKMKPYISFLGRRYLMNNVDIINKSSNHALINQLLPLLSKSLETLIIDCAELVQYLTHAEQESCIQLLNETKTLSSRLAAYSENHNFLDAKPLIEDLERKLALLSDKALGLEPQINNHHSVKTYFSMLAHELSHVRNSAHDILRLY